MEPKSTPQIERFNQLWNILDGTYHEYARRCGLSDMTMWLLYALWQSEAGYTQRELCAQWCEPPQTVNSALKALERQELVRLEPVPGNRKNKRAVLTGQGQALAREVIAPLLRAERRSFAGLVAGETEQLFALMQRHVELLREALSLTLPAARHIPEGEGDKEKTV